MTTSEKDLAAEAPDLQAIDTMLSAMKEAQKLHVNRDRLDQLVRRVHVYRVEILERLNRRREAENDLEAMRISWHGVSKAMHAEIERLLYFR